MPVGTPAVTTPAPSASASVTGARAAADETSLAEAIRTITYLMLFRVGLATALLLAVVATAFGARRMDTLSGPYARFAFGLLTVTYGATLAYALVLKRIRNPVRFAYVQIGVDLASISLLVHATGGAQSGYAFLFLVDVVAVALLPKRYGAVFVATASVLLMIGIGVGGYLRWLPPLPMQLVMPWDMTRAELLSRLALNVAGIVSVGALGMNLSMQTRRASEQLVVQQQAAGDLASLHQNTIRCLSSGLVTVTLDGSVTSINEAACEILGITESAAMGQPLSRRIPGLSSALEEAGPVGSVKRQEVDAILPDQTVRRLGVSAAPLSDHTGKIIGRVIHFQDLTELRRMQLAVARSERLATIGRLAAGVAHEIRNPLASISGSVEVLRTLPGADDDSRQLIDIAVREVERLDRLITDLLDYARPRAEERQPLDLGEVASELAKAFAQEKRDHEIRMVVEADEGVGIEGASSQLRQVLWNLIRNAADAMLEGGTIRIRVMHEELTGGGRESTLSVSDTGVGMAAEEMDRIFEPFFSSKPGGSGLGLATVARIVEDHRGTIDTTSQEGRGTTFTLRFPSIALP